MEKYARYLVFSNNNLILNVDKVKFLNLLIFVKDTMQLNTVFQNIYFIISDYL